MMNTTQWGRKETILFPPHSPIYSYGAIFFALILTSIFVYLRFSYGQTPLQQFYTPIYAKSAAGGALNRKGKYQLLYVGDGAKAGRLATESDVQEGVTATPNGKHIPLAISAQATAHGLRIIYRGEEQTFFDAPLHAYLRTAVFGGDQLRSIYASPLLFGFLSLLAQLPFAIRKDIRRRKELKYGRRLKGPVLLTPKEFNKTVNGDGIGFVTTEAKEMMRIAAHTTRDKKEIHTPSEVLAAHRQVAAEFGNQADRVVQEARDRANSMERKPLATAPERVQEAVTFAKNRNFEREAVTDERDIMRDALRRGMGDLTYSQVRGHFEQRATSGEFQIVPGQKHETGRQFTTREAIAEELSTIKQMQQGRQAAEPMMRQDEAAARARSREFLNPAQQRAIEEVLTSQDRIHGLQGLAGSGKTSALSCIREGAEQNGYAVEGFAPTSRAAGKLRDAGIPAATLQGFLARGGVERNAGDPNARHLYMLDESSLASTRQMQSFLEKIGPQDRVLLIGDTRQHQGVDAGKPFEQMQEAGMRTSQLDQIVRQKDPELLRAVEHLSRNETATGVQLLQQHGRITEIPDRQQRIEAIAKEYVGRPENTLIVSPDNASRRDINDAVRAKLQNSGALSKENHPMTVLTQRSELTSADRNWAVLYQPADVLYYTRGSKELGIERGSYATVVATSPKDNQLTVERQDGQHVTYNPERLHGIAAYREIVREFSEGDRIQFTVSKPDIDVKNRDLGTIERIEGTNMSVSMDGEKDRILTFDSSQMRHFDHGYAVTSHSSQGLTTDRVLVNMDTTAHPELINTRFAYVSVSRASQDARIYTNDVSTLAERLSTDISKASAVEVSSPRSEVQSQQPTPKEQTMTNTREQSQEEQRRQFQHEAQNPANNNTQAQSEIDLRHYAPIQTALPNEASGYDWKRETGDIQSYQHNERGGWLHIDPQGQFYDRQAAPISREMALDHAGHLNSGLGIDNAQELAKPLSSDQGFSL
jgi:ATP-dependent exoDNAse (exonuclease V) alpha subunit